MLAVANTPEINDREEHGASNKLWETSRLVYLLEDARFSPNNNLLPDGPKELCCRFRDMLENTRIALFPYEPANHETDGVESSPVAPPKRVSGCNSAFSSCGSGKVVPIHPLSMRQTRLVRGHFIKRWLQLSISALHRPQEASCGQPLFWRLSAVRQRPFVANHMKNLIRDGALFCQISCAHCDRNRASKKSS